jgi:hypothetical protein
MFHVELSYTGIIPFAPLDYSHSSSFFIKLVVG